MLISVLYWRSTPTKPVSNTSQFPNTARNAITIVSFLIEQGTPAGKSVSSWLHSGNESARTDGRRYPLADSRFQRSETANFATGSFSDLRDRLSASGHRRPVVLTLTL